MERLRKVRIQVLIFQQGECLTALYSEYSTERFEGTVDQLLATISRQAREAELSLAKAETCHEMLRVELALQMGQFDNMTAYEAAQLGSMWKTQRFLLEENV